MQTQPLGSPSVDLRDPNTSRVAKRAFANIMRLWHCSDDDAQTLLGRPSRTTYYAWKKGEGGTLSRDTFERISYVLGIYKDLQVLFHDNAVADAWINKPNDAFGGRSALARMLAGNISDLHSVRAYLDYVRGGQA